MSTLCYQCQKISQPGNSRSHSKIATKRRFKPNLQTRLVSGKRVKLCSSCIRSVAKAQ